MGILIDSTVFVHAERAKQSPESLLRSILERFGDVDLGMSVMTAGELFHGCWRADTPARRARREEFVESILAVVPAVPISLSIMRIFGEVNARLRRSGHVVPTSDLLIACTPLARHDEVITGNPRHFDRVPGLVVRALPPAG